MSCLCEIPLSFDEFFFACSKIVKPNTAWESNSVHHYKQYVLRIAFDCNFHSLNSTTTAFPMFAFVCRRIFLPLFLFIFHFHRLNPIFIQLQKIVLIIWHSINEKNYCENWMRAILRAGEGEKEREATKPNQNNDMHRYHTINWSLVHVNIAEMCRM